MQDKVQTGDFKAVKRLQNPDSPGKPSERPTGDERGTWYGVSATPNWPHENFDVLWPLRTRMEEVRLSAARLVAILLSGWCALAAAQTSPQDGIDRNLLQRQQQSTDFHVRLYDAAKAAGAGALIPLPPVPHSFVGPELYEAPSGGASGVSKTGLPPDAAIQQQQLNDSQVRRQLELQTQNRIFDEPTRQQQSQIQQLQFGRENQAQQLQQQIQRDSNSLMQRSH
jgi:hypothetical protein